ncbi:MAG: OmpA family protein [Bacteroidota bacterium]
MKTLRTLLVVVFTFTAFSLSAQLYDKKWTISAGAYFNDFVVAQNFDRLFTDAHWNHKGIPVRISAGYYLAKHWTAVGQFSMVKLDNPYFEGEDQFMDFNLGAQFRFLYEKMFDPYLYATIGGASLQKNFHFAYNGGLGFNIWFSRSFGFYSEMAYEGLLGVDPDVMDMSENEDYEYYKGEYKLSDNLNYSFGFRFCPGKEDDTDEDGIPDRDDLCPEVFGVEEFEGCPDTDGDGIQDSEDACPEDAGLEVFQGCPDTDGDSIIDSEDACPEDAGTPEFNGCPDTDGDGIIDKDDACPTEAGPEEYQGCPDSDGDGIPDNKDNCPDEAGEAGYDGCPPPPPPPLDLGIVVYFGTDLTDLSDEDKAKLDNLADQLINSEESTVIAQGHTDNTGAASYNQGLSERRAQAVKDYLLEKGVPEDKITIEGYGEDQATGDNDTEEGRTANRRVEFK